MKKKFSILIAILLLIMILSGCTILPNNTTANVDLEGIVSQPVAIHTYEQYKFLQKNLKGANGNAENSKPQNISFKWDFGGDSTNYTITFSENANLENSFSYHTQSKNLQANNFKIATKYFWTVTTDEITSEVKNFVTEDSCPRNIAVDGVTNMRDLGGWKIADNKRINQGLIYRCGRLNKSSAKSPKIEITQNGISTMREFLGIKTEIDLRQTSDNEVGGISQSPLGSDINYINCPMCWDGNMWTQNQKQIIKVFNILADKANYPIIYHCNIGTDRTGMISYLVGALLGMSEEDLITDYMFSNLGNIGGKRSKSNLTNNSYFKAVNTASGSTLSEKTYNALVSHGVSSQNLDAIISIFTN